MLGQGEFENPDVVNGAVGGYSRIRYGGKAHARFETRAIENEKKSSESGRPIYDDVDFIIIRSGEYCTIERPVFETDGHGNMIMMYPHYSQEYRRWKEAQGEGPAMEGTPLPVLTFLAKSRVAEFRAKGIYVVEQLAGLSDVDIQQFGMGSKEDRRKARVFLEAAADSALEQKLAAENEQLKARIAALEEMARGGAYLETPKNGKKGEKGKKEEAEGGLLNAAAE